MPRDFIGTGILCIMIMLFAVYTYNSFSLEERGIPPQNASFGISETIRRKQPMFTRSVAALYVVIIHILLALCILAVIRGAVFVADTTGDVTIGWLTFLSSMLVLVVLFGFLYVIIDIRQILLDTHDMLLNMQNTGEQRKYEKWTSPPEKSAGTASLITCSECGEQVAENASACHNCGNPIKAVLQKESASYLIPCPDCRTKVSENASACPNCGRPIKAVSPS